VIDDTVRIETDDGRVVEAPTPAAPAAERRRRPRRCLADRQPHGRERLVRFVLDPEGRVVPDVAGRLPGRGMWLSADRDVVNRAVARNLFAKAARGRAVADAELPGRVEALLARRCLDLLGLARRAGEAASGYDAVRIMLLAGEAGVLLAARDGAAGGRDKLRALAPELPLITAFTSSELGAALGREGGVVHAAVARGSRLARRLVSEAGRLAGFRPDSLVPAPGGADDATPADDDAVSIELMEGTVRRP
jgi:uncharacterized protein